MTATKPKKSREAMPAPEAPATPKPFCTEAHARRGLADVIEGLCTLKSFDKRPSDVSPEEYDWVLRWSLALVGIYAVMLKYRLAPERVAKAMAEFSAWAEGDGEKPWRA
jgi:hypothetical protein